MDNDPMSKVSAGADHIVCGLVDADHPGTGTIWRSIVLCSELFGSSHFLLFETRMF